MPVTEERLSRVEMALENFISQVSFSLDRLSGEMTEFKNEMREDAKRRSLEMTEFKNEMREDAKRRSLEMTEFKNEMRKSQREMNKRWGDLAHKMGTIVEDIIYPGIIPLVKKYFQCDPLECGIRIRKKRGALRDEFDIIVVAEKYVFLVEIKSALNHNHVLAMEEKVCRFRQLFPEHEKRQVVTILGSLTIERGVVNLCTKKNFYALAYREWEYLDIINFKELPFAKNAANDPVVVE